MFRVQVLILPSQSPFISLIALDIFMYDECFSRFCDFILCSFNFIVHKFLIKCFRWSEKVVTLELGVVDDLQFSISYKELMVGDS